MIMKYYDPQYNNICSRPPCIKSKTLRRRIAQQITSGRTSISLITLMTVKQHKEVKKKHTFQPPLKRICKSFINI